MKHAPLWLAVLLSIFLLPSSVTGGMIRTSITTRQIVTARGAIELECKVRNKGDATAHKVRVSLTLGDLVKRYDGLGDNPAGGEIRLTETLMDPGLLPGRYTAVIRADFEEQTGTPHHAFHFFEIPYRTAEMPGPGLPLEMQTRGPDFNRKAFWAREGSVALSIKNNSREEIRLTAQLYLPEGFSSKTPDRVFLLGPEQATLVEIPLRLESEGKPLNPYHLLVGCDHKDAHHSWDLKGTIQVEEHPVWSKAYLVLGGLVMVAVFGVLLFRRPRSPISAN